MLADADPRYRQRRWRTGRWTKWRRCGIRGAARVLAFRAPIEGIALMDAAAAIVIRCADASARARTTLRSAERQTRGGRRWRWWPTRPCAPTAAGRAPSPSRAGPFRAGGEPSSGGGEVNAAIPCGARADCRVRGRGASFIRRFYGLAVRRRGDCRRRDRGVAGADPRAVVDERPAVTLPAVADSGAVKATPS